MTKEDLDEAHKQLDELAVKLGVSIGGCGCCESPWLYFSGNNPWDFPMIERVKIGKQDDE